MSKIIFLIKKSDFLAKKILSKHIVNDHDDHLITAFFFFFFFKKKSFKIAFFLPLFLPPFFTSFPPFLPHTSRLVARLLQIHMFKYNENPKEKKIFVPNNCYLCFNGCTKDSTKKPKEPHQSH